MSTHEAYVTDIANCLPHGLEHATLVGQVWRTTANGEEPSVMMIRDGVAFDITEAVPTVADLFRHPDVLVVTRQAHGEDLGRVEALVERSITTGRAGNAPTLFTPDDLQAIKAYGMAFTVSLIERVIGEQAGGDPVKARDVRTSIVDVVGSDLSKIKPGPDAVTRLGEELQRRDARSQHMEVDIGPDTEVFSKSQPMPAVRFGADVGLCPASRQNNPEPEIVLAVSNTGHVVGTALDSDANLRDAERHSVLLLGKYKDNNGSCATGPFVRSLDEHFAIDAIHAMQISFRTEDADDGFVFDGVGHVSEVSRGPLDLVAQTCRPRHQYPDGSMLFLGAMFSSTKDRDTPGAGFTYHLGDRVTISTPPLGALVGTVRLSTGTAPWTSGVRVLYRSLATCGLVRQDRPVTTAEKFTAHSAGDRPLTGA